MSKQSGETIGKLLGDGLVHPSSATGRHKDPELNLELPPTAIGKDYLDQGALIASTPSGSGYQLSLFGVLGASLGRSEGIELHILGLTLGIDPFDFAIKLPSVGRIGSR